MTTPVILDTDIGDDIDDTWALAMMLRSPELDVKLIIGNTGDTHYRADLIGKILEVAGRTDIPVGIGLRFDTVNDGKQAAWLGDYTISDYPGPVHDDGVGAIIDTIMNAPEPVTLLCIGPLANIAEALEREPRITQNARVVGMFGSIHRGYNGAEKVHAEYNVAAHTDCCQKVFAAPWLDMTITPLDTCGIVILDGDDFQKIKQSDDPLMAAVMGNCQAWLDSTEGAADRFEGRSSVLFDTVAVYLAFTDELLVMEEFGVRVSDDGYTRIDPDARPIRVATDWRDLGRFNKFLVQRLLGDDV